MFRLYLLILFQSVYTETWGSNNIKILVQTYEKNLKTSLNSTKSDNHMVDSWNVEFDVKRVNITIKYRMEMNRHTEHNFAISDAKFKWKECVNLFNREINKSEITYYENERDCLKTTTTDEQEKRNALEQVEKEIRKWRRGYRYLVRLCDQDNPNDKEGSELCLVQYMERDNYNKVVERLLVLKLEAKGDLFVELNISLLELEECLKTQLSEYLQRVRTVMKTLKRCYNM